MTVDTDDWRISNRIWIHYSAVIEHSLKLLAKPPTGMHWQPIGFDEDHNLSFQLDKCVNNCVHWSHGKEGK